MFQGLRSRLLLYYLLVMAAILSVFGTGVYVFFSRNLYRQLDKRIVTLAQSATLSFSRVEEGGQQYLNRVEEVPWRDIFNRDRQSLEWFDARGNLLGSKGFIKLDDSPKTGTTNLRQEETGEMFRTHTVSVFIRDNSELDPPSLVGFIRASQSLREIETIQNQLLWVLIVGGMMTLILIGLGGFWLTQKAIEPIEASFQRLKQFTADASHELRSPLTAIKASVDLMRNHPERVHPKDAKKLAAIAGATLQMSEMLGNLLFLARNDAKATMAPVDRQLTKIFLDGILQNCTILLEPLANEKQIALNSHIATNIAIMGDSAQLSRLFSNLIENALQYTPEGGSVTVDLQAHGRYALVKVRDTGIGIAPEQIERVFDRFWRADKARSRRQGGTGLGLAIAAAIAKHHGGKITVTSELDVGSCFLVRLPLATVEKTKLTDKYSSLKSLSKNKNK
ncbi:cell wall metabolism sensor histidine kinase WalK [Myxosarcina sp. GI1]|uniref:sensor histidine kinase n=1 Tax=Myxosarcina sp. GI1 TaxID=1541065 RepID=UPI00055F2157|nr:HAMP domain-containing sensor histidine kinase [Myxosarcina sp. GI1]